MMLTFSKKNIRWWLWSGFIVAIGTMFSQLSMLQSMQQQNAVTGLIDAPVTTTTTSRILPTTSNSTATSQQQQNSTSPAATKSAANNETAAICMIAKDEEKYLDEWVVYNLLVLGFDTLYIYDNSDNFTLQNYTAPQLPEPDRIAPSRIVIEHYPYTWKQRAAYRKCLSDHGNRHTWLALIDGDEFLVLKKHDTIVEVLQEHCASGSLSINWYVFGTANRTHYEPLPVLQRFQYREAEPTALHKVIVRTRDYDGSHPKQKRGVHSPHSVLVVPNTTQHNTDGRTTVGVDSPKGPTNVVVLHHYMYKSQAEWKYKWCDRGNVAGIHKRCGETPVVGTVFDDSAWVALTRRVPGYGQQ